MQRAAAAFRVPPIKSNIWTPRPFDAIFDSFIHYFKFVKDIALCAFLTKCYMHCRCAQTEKGTNQKCKHERYRREKTSTIRPESAYNMFFFHCMHSHQFYSTFFSYNIRGGHLSLMLHIHVMCSHWTHIMMPITWEYEAHCEREILFSLVSTLGSVCVRACEKPAPFRGGKRNNDVAKMWKLCRSTSVLHVTIAEFIVVGWTFTSPSPELPALTASQNKTTTKKCYACSSWPLLLLHTILVHRTNGLF